MLYYVGEGKQPWRHHLKTEEIRVALLLLSGEVR